MVQTNYLVAWLLKLKNPAIITATLYVIAFIILFPYLIKFHLPIGNTLVFLLGMLLAVAVVTALLNWAYLATMAVPTMAALIVFFLGWIIYILSPAVDAAGQLVVAVFNGFISELGAGGITSNITTIFHDLSTVGDHIGQFLFALGAGIYVHAKAWAGKLNYVAIGAFVTIFALLGVALGFTGLSGVAVFLVIWLMFYMRLQNSSSDDTIIDLRVIFKIVATLVILIGSGAVHFTVSYFSGFQNMFGGAPNGDTFLSIWRYFWTIGLLVGTWQPKWLWKLIPNTYISNVKELLGIVDAGN